MGSALFSTLNTLKVFTAGLHPFVLKFRSEVSKFAEVCPF